MSRLVVLAHTTVRTLWRISHKEGTFISFEQKKWKNAFYVGYDSNYRSDSGDRVSSDLTLFATYDDWGNVMDLHTRHWLDYDIVALVILVLAITLLQLAV